mmetsp:Transcript_10286/g.13392  ORF Transcript_10286/g.13392 Transcript_10286/m.13392 type:complete len:197 (-) Transcript_10286:285-875(-)
MDSSIDRNAPPAAALSSASTAFLCTDCTRRSHYPVYHDYNTNYLVHGRYIPKELYCPICADDGLQNAHTIHWHLETVISPLERTALAQKYAVPTVPSRFNQEVHLESRPNHPLQTFTEIDADFITAALESDSQPTEDDGQNNSTTHEFNSGQSNEDAQPRSEANGESYDSVSQQISGGHSNTVSPPPPCSRKRASN